MEVFALELRQGAENIPLRIMNQGKIFSDFSRGKDGKPNI